MTVGQPFFKIISALSTLSRNTGYDHKMKEKDLRSCRKENENESCP